MEIIKENDEFSSLLDLENAIKSYEKNTHTNLIKTSSRTVAGARKKGLKRYVDPKLEYVEINYACIKFGKFKSKSCGVRNTSSYKDNCPVEIRVRVNKEGTKFVITNCVTEHSHVQSEAIYNHLPRQRRLDPEAKEMAANLVKMQVNKKILQNELMKKHNIIVTLKDIHNLSLTKKTCHSALEELVNKYKDNRDVSIDIVKDENGILKGIFYQDEEMKRIFNMCPEILFVDAIYKVNDLRMPLYVFLIEDSNGLSEIVGFCLLTSEDKENVSNMAELLKNHNPCSEKIKTIVSDKDFTEREAMREHFPQAHLLICIFHALRSMSREITVEKMGITKGERTRCLDILQSMVYAKNDDEYDELRKRLQDTEIRSVIDYFEANWHDIRDEWVICFQSVYVTFGNRTNNRLESINQKITQIVSRLSSLDQLFEGLEHLMTTLRTERDHIAANVFSKTTCLVKNMSDVEQSYYSLLTPFAFSLVSTKFKLKEKVKISTFCPDTQTATVDSSAGILQVSTESCKCAFATSMMLPCHHIFKVRELCGLSCFLPDLCAIRWTRDYYRQVCRLFPNETQPPLLENNIENDLDGNNQSNVNCIIVESKKKKILSQHEKYRVAMVEAKKIATLASESAGSQFKKRMNLMHQIVSLWEKNLEVDINVVGSTSIESNFEVEENPGNTCPIQETEQSPIQETEQSPIQETEQSPIQETEQNPIKETEQNSIHETEQNEPIPSHTTHHIEDKPQENEVNIGTKNHTSKTVMRTIIKSQTTTEVASVSNIPCLPPKIPKRGRPKGRENTVIGLPNKKIKHLNKPVPFERLMPLQKDKVMLQWFVSKPIAQAALCGKIIEEDKVEQVPFNVSSAVLDETVCILKIRRYFTDDAWASVMQVVEIKKKNPIWLCPMCSQDAQTGSICCSGCLIWSHFVCVNVKSSIKKRMWFCNFCIQQNGDI